MPNIRRGDEDTRERVYGHDYDQDLMLWAMAAAIEGKDLARAWAPGGLVDRAIHAGRQG